LFETFGIVSIERNTMRNNFEIRSVISGAPVASHQWVVSAVKASGYAKFAP
jgi:hypothetical protein